MPLSVFYIFSAGMNFIRQILTLKDDPQAESVNIIIICFNDNHLQAIFYFVPRVIMRTVNV